jgi:hypothetical protein
MNYLIVCKTDNRLFLLMALGNNSGIQAYESKEKVMKAFDGYTEAWKRDATWSVSACFGMMQMQPVAIKAPDDFEDIKKYITEMKTYKVAGGPIGRGYIGLPVNEDILELKEFDIWNETMVLAGIK